MSTRLDYAKDEVAELYRDGYTMAEIGTIYREDPATVMRVLHSAGVKTRGAHPRKGLVQIKTRRRLARMLRLRGQGLSYRQMQKRLGLTWTTIRRHLEKHAQSKHIARK